MQRILSSRAIQAKLTISQPGDQYEQEADRVADQVMRMPDPKMINAPAGERGRAIQIQRMCSGCEDEVEPQTMEDENEEEKVQPKEVAGDTPELTPDAQAQVNAVRGGGQPLSESARAFFEPRFGYDFSNVRVHTDARAAESARALKAEAYTLGQDVVFGSGRYAPVTQGGKRLLAHELAHTIQQGFRRREFLAPIQASRSAISGDAIRETRERALSQSEPTVSRLPRPSVLLRQVAGQAAKPAQSGNVPTGPQQGVDPKIIVVQDKKTKKVKVFVDGLLIAELMPSGSKSGIDIKADFAPSLNLRIAVTDDVTVTLSPNAATLAKSGQLSVIPLSRQMTLPVIVTEGQELPQMKIPISSGPEFGGKPKTQAILTEPEEKLDTFEDLMGSETEETSEEGIGSFFEGAIVGDFGENTSYSAIAGQTVVGFIPIVGQIADIRDISAATTNVIQGKEGSWIQLGISVVAIIPGLDFLKGGSKVGRKLLKEAAEKEVSSVAKSGIKALRKTLSKEAIKLAAKSLRVLMAARRELIERLERLLANGNTRKETLPFITKARNSIRDHWKSHDFAGALRDKLGVPVRERGTGEIIKHLEEVQTGINSLENLRGELIKQLKKLPPGTPVHRLLTEEKEAIDEVLRLVSSFLEIK